MKKRHALTRLFYYHFIVVWLGLGLVFFIIINFYSCIFLEVPVACISPNGFYMDTLPLCFSLLAILYLL